MRYAENPHLEAENEDGEETVDYAKGVDQSRGTDRPDSTNVIQQDTNEE